MLNKSICKRCIDHAARNEYNVWTVRDEELWKKGIVVCPFGLGSNNNAEAVDRCPYALEHLMKENQNAK